MRNRWGCKAMILASILVGGCDAIAPQSAGKARPLTELEVDQVTAGSAAAVSNVAAVAIGPAPQTSASASTLTSSGILVPAPPFLDLRTLNYADSQGLAAASNAPFTAVDGSSHTEVASGGGAWIDATSSATATGSRTGQSQTNMNFTGLSIGPVDLVLGTAVAAACCAPMLAAQTTAAAGGEGYWQTLQAHPLSDTPSQSQSRVDVSVASSALPILDAGQVSALIAPTLSQSIGQ
jgi:hypothetical protein